MNIINNEDDMDICEENIEIILPKEIMIGTKRFIEN